MLYSAAAHQWPDNYFSVGTSVDPMVSRKLTKYALFRLGPVFLAGAFVAVTTRRLHDPAWLGLLLMGAIHLGHTHIRAVVRTVRHGNWRTALTPIAFHLSIAVGVAVTLYVAALTARFSRPLIPHPADLSIALWAGLLAAVLGYWVQRLTFRPSDLPVLLQAVRREVGPDLISYAHDSAVASRADAQLVEAILLAEALNRPAWVRHLENVKGRLLHGGTYGVMQVTSSAPISDRESIDRVVATFAGVTVPRDEYGSPRRVVLHALAERHNPGPNFVSLVDEIYSAIDASTARSTRARDAAGRPLIEVDRVVRAGGQILIEGHAQVYENTLLYCSRADGEFGPWSSTVVGSPGGGNSFTVTVAVETREVLLQPELMGEESDAEDRQLRVSCDWPDAEGPTS